MPYSTCTDFETFYQLRQANIYHSTTEALLSMNYYITNIHILYLKNKYKCVLIGLNVVYQSIRMQRLITPPLCQEESNDLNHTFAPSVILIVHCD